MDYGAFQYGAPEYDVVPAGSSSSIVKGVAIGACVLVILGALTAIGIAIGVSVGTGKDAKTVLSPTNVTTAASVTNATTAAVVTTAVATTAITTAVTTARSR